MKTRSTRCTLGRLPGIAVHSNPWQFQNSMINDIPRPSHHLLICPGNEGAYNMHHARLCTARTHTAHLIIAMPPTFIFHRILLFLQKSTTFTTVLFLLFLIQRQSYLEDAPSSLGHNVENVIQEQSSWQENKNITPAHGKVHVCGRCCKNRGI